MLYLNAGLHFLTLVWWQRNGLQQEARYRLLPNISHYQKSASRRSVLNRCIMNSSLKLSAESRRLDAFYCLDYNIQVANYCFNNNNKKTIAFSRTVKQQQQRNIIITGHLQMEQQLLSYFFKACNRIAVNSKKQNIICKIFTKALITQMI